MYKPFRLIGLIAMWALLSLSACQAISNADEIATPLPGQVEPLPLTRASINVVELADLDQTRQISVLRRPAGCQDSSVACAERLVISDKEIIQALIENLDAELYLQPRTEWPAAYTLVFHLGDGSQFEMDFVCEMCTPSFLRGGQPFWHGQDVVTPDSFNRLIGEQLEDATKWEALQQ
jgi:hypothetical protein